MYAIYLRKSRLDTDRSDAETLETHRKTLEELATRQDLRIGHVYSEVASGDTIAARPEMQKLLEDLKSGAWDGILVMDIDRLGRGNQIDQGVIFQVFQEANAKIITPYKTYDPSDPSDQEFFEFRQFMARGEYRYIKRRMMTGRDAAAKAGRWTHNKTPFGYKRVKLQKGYTLEPSDDAPIVKWVFEQYATTQTGVTELGRMVARMGIDMTETHIVAMLNNRVYLGEVSCKGVWYKGLHPALIDHKTWDACRLHAKVATPRADLTKLVNPFAKLIVCGECGRHMTMAGNGANKPHWLVCRTKGCPTSGIYLDTFEAIFLAAMRDWLKDVKLPVEEKKETKPPAKLEALTVQKEKIEGQLERLHDLLEQGIYSTDEFIKRRGLLTKRLEEISHDIAQLTQPEESSREEQLAKLTPQIQEILGNWEQSTPAEKRELAASVVHRIIYHKTKRCGGNTPGKPEDHLTLDIEPLI